MDFSEFLVRLFFPSYRDLAIGFSVIATVFLITVISETVREYRKEKKMKDELNDEEKNENGEWILWN